MDSIRILIADYNEAFRENLAELLGARYTVLTCDDGKALRDLLDSFEPDILVLDMMLPNADVFTLLEQARTREKPLEVYVFSGFLASAVQEWLLSIGIYGMLRKPCDIHQAECNIRALARRLPAAVRQRETDAVSQTLLRLGFSSHLDGYHQLLLAIPMFIRDPKQPLNKVIYTSIAEQCGLSGGKPVERSIREAIAHACGRGDTALWRYLFPPETRGKCSRPSNKVFISRICEYLRREHPSR